MTSPSGASGGGSAAGSKRLDSLSSAQARRIALAAQGFADPPHATPTRRTLQRTFGRTGVLQIDSVNVLQRAHYMPLYSRMGPYDTDLLDRASGQGPRLLVEYWAHVAAFMPVELWPHMRHRMRFFAEHDRWLRRAVEKPEVLERVRAAIRADGAATARDLDDGDLRRRDHWGWNWSVTKDALEYLFFIGELAVAGRNSAFERRYDLPERVLPAEVVNAPTPAKSDAQRTLVERAARSHGVATLRCLADYYRMGTAETRAAVAELEEAGTLIPVRVEGWSKPAYLHAEARLPRRIGARTLLSPFDPVVWERQRTEALFDFFYRIEIYTPAAKRQHGYYVLPFLLDDRIVARVDLKAERRTGVLQVLGSYAEPTAPQATPAELAAELARLAGWLGLVRIEVAGRGDLAPGLTEFLRHYVP